uniref:CRIB domain-containing protein n=1 Tax=Anthurium amnicola TaxID=1678845 RepID=A0A1D1YP30_9ARAE
MTTKMKGLLKGLRYISQIFDTKEQEMQIGYPTDVRHVAHIGWDGPSVNPPSWMNEFRSVPLSALGAEATADTSPARFASHDLNRDGVGVRDSPLRELPDQLVPKPRRQASPGVPAVDSPTLSPSVPRRPRRKSTAGMPVDSPAREPPAGRRHAANGGDGGNSGHSTPTDSPARELPLVPKVARKKKTKGDSAAAATRSAKSRAQPQLSEGGDRENLAVIASPGTGEGM